ncbi:AAA family ATPase [Prauserella cavernicola]|uniref:AAA family ATPase n=1 Tax=Prauserella cavernicola TaxID=2800127 RepID=A0A934V6Y2_9PSEU|nr:AAA family ATPase [Prauserella cavernicola]MBK1786148.1 AAA family ATPase [Prauserella cavernicola]
MTRPPDRLRMDVEHRCLLVVAGLPGAGKSTLLRNIESFPSATVLDTDQQRARLRGLFPAGTPYSWYRPLVHVLHLLTLVLVAARTRGPVVVHDPATGAIARFAFVALGTLTSRPLHLLWIDCTVEEALAGQRRRGRVLLGWSFSRHARQAPRTRDRLLAGDVPRGWRTAKVTDREGTRHGLVVHAQPGGQAAAPR